jgi:hypothetical protein
MFILKHSDEPIFLIIIKLFFLFLHLSVIYLFVCILCKYSNYDNLKVINLRKKRKIFFKSPNNIYTQINYHIYAD